MTPLLDLPERYRQQLLALLEAYVPEAEAWAYGSRVQGTNHEASDLDVVLRGPNLAELGTEYMELVEAVKESAIPILIDIFDWARLPESFHREIERKYVILKEARSWREPELVDQHGQPATIDLDPLHRRTVLRLLQGYVPGCEVRAHGPRAEWTAEQHSRLDITVLGASNVSPYALSDLRAAFQRSYLPFGVNIADWDAITAERRGEIGQRHVVLQRSTPNVQWRSVALGEVATTNDDQIASDHRLEFLHYLDTGSITDGRVDRYQQLVTGRDKIPSRARRRCRRGDIVYSTVRPNQRHYGILHELPENAVVSTGFTVIRPDELNVHNEYLYWYLTQNHIVEQLQAIAEHSTSAYPSIKASDLERLMLLLPPIGEQRRIASVLRKLDDRIELNRRMCETLEEMAQALFKSWFVDFDPVRAKMDGRWQAGESLPGLPAHLYDLFPDHLVDSELGPIPPNWHIESLGSVLQLAYGKSLPAHKRNSGMVPVLGSNGRVGWHDQKYVDGPGIVVGRKGNPGTVTRVSEDFYPIDTTFYVTLSDERLTHEFTYCALKQLDLAMIATDSAVPGLNRNLAYMCSLMVPNKEAADAFSECAFPLWCEQHVLEQQSVCLTDLRDTLLPKLVSGEVRLPEVEEMVVC